jgi:hypothetical protein
MQVRLFKNIKPAIFLSFFLKRFNRKKLTLCKTNYLQFRYSHLTT